MFSLLVRRVLPLLLLGALGLGSCVTPYAYSRPGPPPRPHYRPGYYGRPVGPPPPPPRPYYRGY